MPTRLPITVANGSYNAVAVSAANLVPAGGTNGAFLITLMTNLAGGNILIEFQSRRRAGITPSWYDTNADLSTPLAAQPAITAPANRVQWIDDGPPKTVSAPGAGMRFYRVLLNP